jgi:RNA polymerase sigma factor (sigma-70 family)
MTDPVSVTTDEEPLQNENLLVDLKEALQHLNTEQKTCIWMFYLEKKSYQEIATETGFNILQVKSYIQNGKRNLRLLLQKKLDNLEK